MVVKDSKTKFTVINYIEADKIPVLTHDITVKYSPSYIYLGASITDAGIYICYKQRDEAEDNADCETFNIC